MRLDSDTMQSVDGSLSLELVAQNEESARLIMEWRNDPVCLATSFDTRPKQWPQFYRDFGARYFEDPSLPCVFVLWQGKRVAFIRFRRLAALVEGKSACDISISVDREHRGKGIGARAIELTMQIPRSAGIGSVVADIKQGNFASLRAFEKAGFRYLHDWSQHCEPDSAGDAVVFKKFVRDTARLARIGGSERCVGAGHPCFVIAEAGSNWKADSSDKDMFQAKGLIDAAAEAGADAVKFQTFRPATTYVANAGESDYLSEAGIKESINDIFAHLAMPYDMLPELADHAKKRNIEFMSSPFSVADFEAVDPFVNVHKIASYEISHLRLIEAAARSGKMTVLSTGASAMPDIAWAVQYFQSISAGPLCLMQCTARYPAPLSSLNLGTIPVLRAKFGLPVGLSDHTRDPITGPLAAVALGASLIEKHFTLDNSLPGPDHAFAVTPAELKQMVAHVRRAEPVIGTGRKDVLSDEEELFYYARRGLQAIKEISPGETLLEGVNFDILRPGKQKRGIHPQLIARVHNAVARRSIASGAGIQLEDIKTD